MTARVKQDVYEAVSNVTALGQIVQKDVRSNRSEAEKNCVTSCQ